MFASRKKKRPSIALSKLSSLIGEDVVITGDVEFTSGIRMDGRVVGNVVARSAEGERGGLLVVSAKGHIEGRVSCGDAVINGTVIGDLEVEHFLELQSNARVSGTIRYRFLQMDVGASVHGQLVQADAVPAADSNVVVLEMDKVASA